MNIRYLLLTYILVLGLVFPALSQHPPHEEGVALYREGKYDKAAELLQKVVETNERNRIAWIYLGASFVQLKQNENATKAFLRADFVDKLNAPVYEKPFKITTKAHAPYTAEARGRGITGSVRIAIELRSNGEVGFIFPVTTLPHGLTESAVKAAKGIRFQPAIQNGVPVAVVTFMEYSFSTY